MFRPRVIPCLQLHGSSLVKTTGFKKPEYIGDPVNTVKIFNELEVDELCFLDIRASIENRQPEFQLLKEIASECFMPLSYGGGINSVEAALKVLSIGFEKVVLNSYALENKEIIGELASVAGSQSVIVAIDYKKDIFGKYYVTGQSGKKKYKIDPVTWAMEVEQLGAGEILLTCINREGSWSGFDHDTVKRVSGHTRIPLVALGGGCEIVDIGRAVRESGASAVGLGNMVVYQAKGMGVLINFPDKDKLKAVL